MSGYWPTVVLVVFLVAVNAVFAGSEIALVSLREGQLRELERRNTRAATTLARLAREPNRYMATIQIGVTLAGFLASATAAVALAEPLTPLFSVFGTAAKPAAIAVTTMVLTFVTLVFGELAPKRLAMQFSLRWSLLVARPLDLLSRLSRPLVWTLSITTNAVVRALGGNPSATSQPPTPAELRELVSGHAGLSSDQRQIILGALEIRERELRAVLVPRRSVFTVPAEASTAEAKRGLVRAGHSRAPVIEGGDLDSTVGVVNLRNLVDTEDSLSEAMRPPMVFPETARVSDALRRFKETHEQLALWSTSTAVWPASSPWGICWRRSSARSTTRPTVTSPRSATKEDGALLLPGSFPLHDLPDLGVELNGTDRGSQTTVAGLVLTKLGHIPRKPGERVRIGDWHLEVAAVEGNAITAVRVRRNPQPKGSD